MSGQEIREKISANNKLIASSKHSIFTLNKQTAALLEENKKLRAICKHEFDEAGYCIYCDEEYK